MDLGAFSSRRNRDERVVYSLLPLSGRCPCHIWAVGRMKFASLEINLRGAF